MGWKEMEKKPNLKDGRTHRGMYIRDKWWLLAWYAGKITQRSRPDLIAVAVEEKVRALGILDDIGKVKKEHKAEIRKLLKTEAPDSRTVTVMMSALNT